MDLNTLLSQLKPIMTAAGRLAMIYYNEDLDHYRHDESPVTQADIKVNEFLLDKLGALGDFGILSEENKQDQSYLQYDQIFIVDPIDGTRDFVARTGEFCPMVGLAEKGQVILGLIYNPVKERLYYAARGMGVFCQDSAGEEKINVSRTDNFSQMTMLLSRFHLAEVDMKLKENLYIGHSRAMGSAGLKMTEIARGNGHLYMNTSSRICQWDVAAGAVIVTEAGGMITDTQGNDLVFGQADPYLAHGFVISNGVRHREIIEALSKII